MVHLVPRPATSAAGRSGGLSTAAASTFGFSPPPVLGSVDVGATTVVVPSGSVVVGWPVVVVSPTEVDDATEVVVAAVVVSWSLGRRT